MFPTLKAYKKTIAKRKIGVYLTEETEADCVQNMRRMKGTDETVITILVDSGMFTTYTTAEFTSQINLWRENGNVGLRMRNTRPITLPAGESAWMFIIQPITPHNGEEVDMPISPLAMAFGIMVCGFAYITTDYEVINNLYNGIPTICDNTKCSSHASLHKCGSCQMVSYCSKSCQRENWTTHRKNCSFKKPVDKVDEVDD